MNSLWSSRNAGEAMPTGRAAVDIADTGVANLGEQQSEVPDTAGSPTRPLLSRNILPAAPPPPTHPAPSPAADFVAIQQQPQYQQQQHESQQQPPDSLSLAQLRRIVAEFPRSSPVAYDFVYEDTAPVDEEIDEWFVYQFWQCVCLNAIQRAFQWRWEQDVGPATWAETDLSKKNKFTSDALAAIKSGRGKVHSDAICVVLYLVLGRWGSTAGGIAASATAKDSPARSVATPGQLSAMTEGVKLVSQLGGVPIVWAALREAFKKFWTDDTQQLQSGSLQETQDELMNLMTMMYMMIQMTLNDTEAMAEVHIQLLNLEPSLISFTLTATSKLRWDDAGLVPQAQVFLLLWKSILLVLGGTKELEATKQATSETPDNKEKGAITASPLDYHVFRQEITSKYPAYVPPQPVIPLEADNTSLLPPLPHHPSRNNGSNGILPGPPGSQSSGASILHQPVHIATPAPSPPPSPGVGGKGGKKQNYQTNQNFPFMYPPMDFTSNWAGGKGSAGLQLLVGRRWEGSDVPASILEAGELFSRRVRMTRATRQLWEEREKFLRFERGWEGLDDDLIDELDLSSLTLEDKEELGLLRDSSSHKIEERRVDYGPNDNLDDRVKQRLQTVEDFYAEALPQLQSVVIVLLKAILVNITMMVAQAPLQQQPQQPPQQQGQQNQQPQQPSAGVGTTVNSTRPTGNPLASRSPDRVNGVATGAINGASELSAEDLDAARTREITTKAVSGILLLLLKWFKVSHILKFEYLTQLLLDSNYIPLLLKLFAHQDVQQTVDSKTDVIENSFFYFCNTHTSGLRDKPTEESQLEEEDEEDEESEDEAAPPPIKRRRSPIRTVPTADQDSTRAYQALSSQLSVRPEVDELGYPLGAMPEAPITDFSRRNFFSLINYLRVMQKICKGKAHRNLLLVNYKSSNILRKLLKVPQPELRLYTLKLFKNQVPYCGRKWRQANMRVITAVYLHCRPELRDEWLAGSDIDAEVEEALPLEQALRSLTHWFNVRRYPDKMAAEVRAAMREDQDFFFRELDKLDLNWADMDHDDSSEWEVIATQ